MIGAVWLLVDDGRGSPAPSRSAAIAAGVIWSNALGYRDAVLAPHGQLAELERIGELTAGEGPTLMTEYEPYGVRHFLRDGEPEGVSELRRRTIPLLDGSLVREGRVGRHRPDRPGGARRVYRTLVLRRSPAQSRPPAAYERVWSGRYYEVWQRPASRLSSRSGSRLGDRHDPVGVPRCEAVARARRGRVTWSRRGARSPSSCRSSEATYPAEWEQPGAAARAGPARAGDADGAVDGSGGGVVRGLARRLAEAGR